VFNTLFQGRSFKSLSPTARRTFRHFNSASAIFLLLAGVTACASTGNRTAAAVSAVQESQGGVQAELSADRAANGDLLLVTLKLPSGVAEKDVSVHFGDTDLPLYNSKGSRTTATDTSVYQTVLGVPYQQKPGSAEVMVKWNGGELKLPFTVFEGDYPSSVIQVDNRHVNPSPKDLKQIKRDIAEVGKIYQKVTPIKYWDGPFALPVDSIVTGKFGTKRMFNGELQSFHQGLDLRAPMKTPIHAPAGGVVVLAHSLFFTGNTVLLDHGYGVFTIYAHMSKLKVKKGQIVKAGQLLGLSGMTGRASGPHLHWGAVIHKAKVNPFELTTVMQ
jgi:murein DD-endopeptidase MepM/ murein hydrolase activator NlpD